MSSSPNKYIVKAFKKLIDLLKLEINLVYDQETKTVNEFRIDALEKNYKVIAQMSSKIKSSNDMKHIKGFGKGTLTRIDEILETGTLKEINYLNDKIKKMYKVHLLVEEMSEVIGIGSLTAIRLISKWKIKSMNDFRKRVKNGSIEVNDKIKLGLSFEGRYEKTIPRRYIDRIYEKIRSTISLHSIVCGSYRRGKQTSHDIDLLVWSDSLTTQDDVRNSDKLSKCIKKLKKAKIITDDITSENVKTKYMGFCTYKTKLYRIDIRLIAKESLYTAISYFTGSYEQNIKMRNKAKKLMYKLSEYGLFNVMGKRVPIESEEHLYRILRMKYLEPYER